MRKRYIIYGLLDPDTKQLKYIGKSSSGLKRAAQHWAPYYMNRDRNTLKLNWLKNVLGRNKEPSTIVLIECQTHEELVEAEIDMISYFRYIGCKLTNILDGGEGFTPEQARDIYRRRSPESKEQSKQNMLRGAITTNVRGRNNLRLRKPVLATHQDTKETRWYLSASHAAADGLGSRSAISNCLRPSWRCKGNRGWSFEFVNR